MSIKAKLALFISLFVTVILTLNLSLYHASAEAELRGNAERQMVTIAKQIGTFLSMSEQTRQYMEDLIGENLRNASIAAQAELDPDIANVTNEQLEALSRKLGVDHITLWVRTEDDIVAVKSSDPKEINLSSKSWDYWYTAFHQLFDNHEVTVPQGQKLPNYWAGPVQYSSSDFDRIDKWGYYYDGTTNYMIDPYVDAKKFLDFTNMNGTNALIDQLMEDNPGLLNVAGFDPEFFGKPPILKEKNGESVYNLDVRDIVFGDYGYLNEKLDAALVRHAAATGETATQSDKLDGKHILKSFVPLGEQIPYVVGVVFDYEWIERPLNKQLFTHAMISVGLILAAWAASYFISGWLIRPFREILRRVDEIAQGRFDGPIAVRSRDELGLLSAHVNTMASSLHMYTGKLNDTAEELRDTKEFLESFVGHTSDAIHVTDLEGRITWINQAFETMFGWRGEEVIGRTLGHVTEDTRQEYDDIRRRIVRGESVANHETIRLTKSGHSVDVSITVSPIRDAGGNITAVAEIARNITLRKHAEEAVRRSEKLSVIGQLAAGVAHEIRNPLTTVKGFVQLQRQTGKLVESQLDVILSELDRINLIVSEFLVLAKPQAVPYQSADPKTLLSDVVLLLSPLAHLSDVRIDLQTDAHIPEMKCDPNQLKQVFINVLKNGVEAMPDGGTIFVELRYLPEEERILIVIRDQGCGIPEEHMPHLGEPFFTSKSAGNGLGLMVSQRIIANHKGNLIISSQPGVGTEVEIRLPLDAPSALDGSWTE